MVKKYENEFFTSYFGASIFADEEVIVIAQCAGLLKRAMKNLMYDKQSIIYLLEIGECLRKNQVNALFYHYR